MATPALAQGAYAGEAARQPVAGEAGVDKSAMPVRSGALRALLDAQVEWLMRENPEWASSRGDERFNDRLTDGSPEATARRLAQARTMLERLRALPKAGFGEEDHLDADLLEHELALYVDAAALHEEQMPINAMDGPHIWLPQLAERVPMRTEKHAADYVARLEQVPKAIDDQIRQMRLGLEAGRTPPKVVLAKTLEGIAEQFKPEVQADPGTSPFFAPLRSRPAGDALSARAKEAIAKGIVPAFQRLHEFMGEYIPKSRETLGISAGVDGPAAYELQLRRHTTTNLSAREIHDLGLEEVARLKAEMIRVIGETDFGQEYARSNPGASGDAIFAAALKHLRESPRFYYTNKEDMLRDYRDLSKRIDPELPKLFGRLPRNTYGIREIPIFAARTSPAAYYYSGSVRAGLPGYFMVNTYALDQRPKYGMVSLTLHEAVPGHHFQGSLADELAMDDPTLHEFRTLVGPTAYVEGWALYAERLGLEMGERPASAGGRGLYADPYDYIGGLSDEVWRACRLVVDTGLHAFGWTRQQAIDYMLANSAGTEYDTISEVDRYIGWPGQACAYKVGQLKILELRARAERELGAGFDLRRFHDAVLLGGAMPLPVLEKRIVRWIEGEKAAPKGP